MVTRKLPIPDLAETDRFIQFAAKRGKDGYWVLEEKHNVRGITAGFQEMSDAYKTAVSRHFIKKEGKKQTQDNAASPKLNFDTAFLILRDMEDALLGYDKTPAGEEPPHHFMHAYRCAPKQFQTGLDQLYFSRGEGGAVLKPRQAPVAQPQNKAQGQDLPPPLN
jgi:hypothetical protein